MDRTIGLLGVHGDMALSNLSVVQDLLIEMRLQRQTLMERRRELKGRIRGIQEVVQHQYTTGAASIDDWLS
jgi:hypothetical protein